MASIRYRGSLAAGNEGMDPSGGPDIIPMVVPKSNYLFVS